MLFNERPGRSAMRAVAGMVAIGALAALASCGGGTYQVTAFQPARILTFGRSGLRLRRGPRFRHLRRLLAVGQDLARTIRGEAPPLRWIQHLLVWLALLIGALVGGVAYGAWHIWALALPAAIYVIFFVGLAIRR